MTDHRHLELTQSTGTPTAERRALTANPDDGQRVAEAPGIEIDALMEELVPAE